MFFKIICSYKNKVFISYILNIHISVIFKYRYLKEHYIHINLFSILINNFTLIFKFLILSFLFIKKMNKISYIDKMT